jgi:FKBP-type peptidyl-prolyl cis-trans isomerase FkpA
MKKFIHTFPFFAIAAVTLVSCSQDSKFNGFTKSETGLYYKFYNHAEGGANPKIGDVLKLQYEFKLERNDSLLLDSKQGSADGSGFAQIGLQRVTFAGSLEDGILMMSKGDSASFIVPADSFFLKTMQLNELPKFLAKGDHIKANVKLGEIMSKEMVEADRQKQMEEQQAKMKEMADKEQPLLDKYLADNKITTKPTESGLIFIELKKGAGPKPKANDLVEVNYVGRLLDGTVFDTSIESIAKENNQYNPQRPYEPIKFQLGVRQVIPGWDEGIAMLNKGGKAKFIIPSRIAYGPNPAGPIPPYSSLVFEVELVNFGPAPPQSQQTMPQGQAQGQDPHAGHNH